MNDSRACPALSVLVPTHARAATLVQLLDSLRRQTLAPERFEVVIVDDGSPAPVRLDANAFKFHVVLLRQAQAGPGAARNLGLEHCRAPLVLILNDDAVAAPDLLERHLAAHAELPPKTAVLGTFHFTERARSSAFVRLLDESDLLFQFSGLVPGRRLDWTFFWTCNLSLPVAALREVGGFDAEQFPEALVEDVELGYRLQRRGWSVAFRPECRAEHDHVLTPASYFARGVRLGKYLTRMWRKHADPRILLSDTAQEVQKLADEAVHSVELFRPAFHKLPSALDKLDAEYVGRAMPPSVAELAIKMLRDAAGACFRRGLHRELTGVDPLAVMERGAPAGAITSVVIVSHQALANTQRCIASLRAARDAEHELQLVVVDNGSTDGSAQWLAAQPDLVVIRNPSNFGAPRARNQALAHCRGSWIAFLDNDVFVPRGWLGRALYHGAVDPRVGAIALVANRASKHQQVPYSGGADADSIERAARARAEEFERRGQDCELFTSLAVLVRRETLEAVGGFDERFSPWGFEDDDLALRIRLAGWRNRVALDTFVFHAPYPDEAKHRRHAAWLADNWKHFAHKWGAPGVEPALFDYEALQLGHERNRAREWRSPLPAADAPPPTWRTEEARPEPAARRNVIVLGSGRSGTSLVAGTLAQAGWCVGDDPYPGRPANPKGFFETAEINGINEQLLASALGEQRRLGRMQLWLAVANAPLEFDVTPALRARMTKLASRSPFAFKDPRFCYSLPAWRDALGDALRVCVFREPAATANSIVRECREAEYLAGVRMDYERALQVWCAMYRSALEQRSDGGEWLFLHYDQLFEAEGVARLERFVGGSVARDFGDRALSRSRADRPVSAEAARLYRELCELAGFPPRELEVASELDDSAQAPSRDELTPWPLASVAAERLLAWPRYDADRDLERLLATWAPTLSDDSPRCLCLRHDPACDGELSAAIERLTRVYERVVGAEHSLEVLFVDGAIPERELPRLGRAIRAVLTIPGREDPERERWERGLGVDVLAEPAALDAH